MASRLNHELASEFLLASMMHLVVVGGATSLDLRGGTVQLEWEVVRSQ